MVILGEANFMNTSTNEFFATLQEAVNDPDTMSWHTILTVGPGPFAGTTVLSKANLKIDLNGRTFTGSSPAFEITADNIKILNGILDGLSLGLNNSDSAIWVQPGADNFTLQSSQVLHWRTDRTERQHGLLQAGWQLVPR